MEADNMARNQYDGVIEAVRYTSTGQIDMVRVYERRWLVFSDGVLLDRATLLERLSQGSQFITGHRNPFKGNTFETGKNVRLSGGTDPVITTKDQPGSQDFLANVPVF
jgi:hypothetical protein